MSKLRLENVCYKYEGSRKLVLQDISYEFEKGNIYFWLRLGLSRVEFVKNFLLSAM